MISMSSYLLKDGVLVPVEDFRGPVVDEDYIEGALEMTIDKTPLLTRAYVDLIDQLWAYLIEGMAREVTQGKPFATFYPDSAIEVTLRAEPSRREIIVGVARHRSRGPVTAAAPMAEFTRTFCAEARRFLQVVSLVPSARAMYEDLGRRLATIEEPSWARP